MNHRLVGLGLGHAQRDGGAGNDLFAIHIGAVDLKDTGTGGDIYCDHGPFALVIEIHRQTGKILQEFFHMIVFYNRDELVAVLAGQKLVLSHVVLKTECIISQDHVAVFHAVAPVNIGEFAKVEEDGGVFQPL